MKFQRFEINGWLVKEQQSFTGQFAITDLDLAETLHPCRDGLLILSSPRHFALTANNQHMQTRASTSHSRRRRVSGFTLLEVMIVVAVMVLLVGIVTPALVQMRREAWLGEQTDRVREIMAQARQFAVDEGIEYTFHYEMGGNHAVVLPAENEEDTSEATTESGQSAVATEYARALLELPEELKIRTPEEIEEEGESIPQARFGSLVGNQLEDKRWSKGIKFRFDGTSEDFELRIHDDAKLSCNVTLRGLTGSVRTTQVYTESD